jgi:hypothetical protein
VILFFHHAHSPSSVCLWCSLRELLLLTGSLKLHHDIRITHPLPGSQICMGVSHISSSIIQLGVSLHCRAGVQRPSHSLEWGLVRWTNAVTSHAEARVASPLMATAESRDHSTTAKLLSCVASTHALSTGTWPARSGVAVVSDVASYAGSCEAFEADCCLVWTVCSVGVMGGSSTCLQLDRRLEFFAEQLDMEHFTRFAFELKNVRLCIAGAAGNAQRPSCDSPPLNEVGRIRESSELFLVRG